jgi:predicted nucleic acid-binding protein
MIFLDTSYLLALVQPRDSLHTRAQAWAKALKEPLVVTEYILWELLNALSAPLDRPKAHAVVQQLQSAGDCEMVPASAQLWQTGLQFHHARSDKEWSFTDGISFLVMTKRHVHKALTYDHHFEQAGFEALLRRDPD